MGKKGSGKTELAKYLSSEHERLIVWDFLGQFECNDIANHTKIIEKALANSVFNISIRLPDHYFPDICTLVKQKGNCLFVVDEIDMISSPTSIPKELDYLIRYGRHHSVDLITTARRPAEMHRNLTANADDIYVYHTHEPRDLSYLSRFLDIEVIGGLKQYEYLHYNTLTQDYERGKIELYERGMIEVNESDEATDY